LGITRSELDTMAVTDPRKAVAMDVAAYKANKDIPGGIHDLWTCLRRFHWKDRNRRTTKSAAHARLSSRPTTVIYAGFRIDSRHREIAQNPKWLSLLIGLPSEFPPSHILKAQLGSF
jgi:hypothetical protein